MSKIEAWAAIMPDSIELYSNKGCAEETAEGYGDNVVRLVPDTEERRLHLGLQKAAKFCRELKCGESYGDHCPTDRGIDCPRGWDEENRKCPLYATKKNVTIDDVDLRWMLHFLKPE